LRHQFQSTVSWRSVRAMLIDTAAIWYRLRVLHFYDREAAPATPLSERLRLEPLVLRGSAGRTWLPPPREGGEGAPAGVRGARRETSPGRQVGTYARHARRSASKHHL
jgi:hypothetical protein